MRRHFFSVQMPLLVVLVLILNTLPAFADPGPEDTDTSTKIYLPIVANPNPVTSQAVNDDSPSDALVIAAQSAVSRQIPNGGTTALRATAAGVDGIQWPEFPGGADPDAAAASRQPAVRGAKQRSDFVNRSFSRTFSRSSAADAELDSAAAVAADAEVIAAARNPSVVTSFDGLNFRQQRLANGGNQFSVEPPDQGLCVGNGFVVETVNDVIRVFDTAGTPLLDVVDLNSFYGYPAQIDRTTGLQGPFVTDPSCYFDPDTERWFHVALTLDVVPETGDFIGSNHLDIAVSQTADPTGVWNIYRLPVQNDGTQGTPNHGCSAGPCIGDYPHIGADAYGFYITTNEYSFFGPEYKSANLYALSKQALAAGAPFVIVTQFDTVRAVDGAPGFTIWPAITPDSQYQMANQGTAYFLSSNAAEEANGNGKSNRIILWSLSNTASLATSQPAPVLRRAKLKVETYRLPPAANQKAGNVPLADCLNDANILTPFGLGCWTLFFDEGGPFHEKESVLDTSDTRMQQVYYAGGLLYGALGTAVKVGGKTKAGIAWYVINPQANDGKGKLVQQGQFGLAGNHLSYPAVAVNAAGQGAIAFTVAGNDYYPSAGYAGINASGVGSIKIAAAGVGPQDGFSGYNAFASSGVARPRWGDYGAAVADGNTIWLASEYIAQSCTLAQYLTPPVGSCGGTRAALGNWATRITQVQP